MDWYGLNRTLCGVFEEMRTYVKIIKDNEYVAQIQWNVLISLIEEAQIIGNRLEGAIMDGHDLQHLHDEISAKKKELRELKKEVEENKP